MLKKSARVLALALLTICMLLTSVGSAQQHYTITEVRKQAAAGWHKSYQAHGRTITVDIDIRVPDVDTLPVLRARPLAPSSLAPETADDGSVQEYEIGNALIYDNLPGFFAWIYGDKAHRRLTDAQAISTSGYAGETVRMGADALDWDTAYAQNNPATVRDLDNRIREQFAHWFPDGEADLVLEEVKADIAYRRYDVFTNSYSGKSKAANR